MLRRGERYRGRARIAAPVAYAIVSIVWFVVLGIPEAHDVLAIWLLLGLFCFCLTDVRGYLRGLLVDWLPFFALLIAYDALRGGAHHLARVHYLPQIAFDKFVFFGHNGTVFLQQQLWHGYVTWYDVLCWCVYMTHFFATPILAAVLWKIDNGRFRRYAVTVLILTFVTLATYAIYPAAPPWMASQDHLIGPVTRILPLVANTLGAKSSSLIEHGYQYANNVAAVPSLHAAYSLLVAITLWPKRRWLRPLVVLYPLAMAFTLIYTGEHYMFDIVLGWLYTTIVVMALVPVWRWREARAPAQGELAGASAAATSEV